MLKSRVSQKGSTLLEVLVALLVISVGLIGVAGAMSFSVKSNRSAYLRSQVAFLAYDLADNMRAARAAALDGEFADDCDPAGSLACQYRQSWNQRLVDELGTASAALSHAVGDASEVTITITWDDARGAVRDGQGNSSTDTSPSAQTFVLETRI